MRPVLGLLVAVVLVLPSTSQAQTTAPASDESRIFVDANLVGSARSLAHSREFQSLFTRFGELGSMRATYPRPSRPSLFSVLDVGGGVMLARDVGVGVGYGRTGYEDAADLVATIPHTSFLNAAATGTGATGRRLNRTEHAIHLSVALMPIRTRREQLRLFGGPTFFSYRAEMVRDVSFAQASDLLSPQNSVTVTGFESEDATGRSLGFHVGAEFTRFITQTFGIAAGVRFERGTVKVDREPLSAIGQQIRVGSTRAFLGIRVRLGR